MNTKPTTKENTSIPFMRCKMKDGSIWKIQLSHFLAKIPPMIVKEETPWQKRWIELGSNPEKYTLEEAIKEVAEHLSYRDFCEILEIMEWADIKDHFIIEKPAPAPEELWEKWKEDALMWTDGGFDLLETSGI